MKTCDDCKFRGTYYCSHPHTCGNGHSRCLEIEIYNRIEMIDKHRLEASPEDPSVDNARVLLEEWKLEQQ